MEAAGGQFEAPCHGQPHSAFHTFCEAIDGLGRLVERLAEKRPTCRRLGINDLLPVQVVCVPCLPNKGQAWLEIALDRLTVTDR